MKRSKIAAAIGPLLAFIKKGAVRLDYLDHQSPAPAGVFSRHLARETAEELRMAVTRVREKLDELEKTL